VQCIYGTVHKITVLAAAEDPTLGYLRFLQKEVLSVIHRQAFVGHDCRPREGKLDRSIDTSGLSLEERQRDAPARKSNPEKFKEMKALRKRLLCKVYSERKSNRTDRFGNAS
jgi:hypothetical protein